MSEYKSVARVTALQEAIEAKTGATYGDLADGVQVLLDGYGQGGGSGSTLPSWIKYVKGCNQLFFENDGTMPDGTIIDLTMFPPDTSFNNMFDTSYRPENLTVIFPENYTGKLNAAFYGRTVIGQLKHITLSDITKSVNIDTLFAHNQSLQVISGTKIPYSDKFAITSYLNPLYNCLRLETVQFVENSVTGNWVFNWSAVLTTESIISVANALNATTPYTLTLHATVKTNMESIKGTVTQKTAEDGTTYDFFTADSAGTVTLTEFITTTKGWTLA